MKKILAVIFVVSMVVAFTACKSNITTQDIATAPTAEPTPTAAPTVEPEKNGTTDNNVMEGDSENTMIDYESGIFPNKNWEENMGTYYGDVVSTREVAISIAQAVFNGMEKPDRYSRYAVQAVFFDEMDEIWIVTFWEPWESLDEVVIGDECNIAIQKKDGRVLRIWYEE